MDFQIWKKKELDSAIQCLHIVVRHHLCGNEDIMCFYFCFCFLRSVLSQIICLWISAVNLPSERSWPLLSSTGAFQGKGPMSIHLEKSGIKEQNINYNKKTGILEFSAVPGAFMIHLFSYAKTPGWGGSCKMILTHKIKMYVWTANMSKGLLT